MSGEDLLEAAKEGDAKKILALLNKGINIDFEDSVSNV
jgi:hypothetical protein